MDLSRVKARKELSAGRREPHWQRLDKGRFLGFRPRSNAHQLVCGASNAHAAHYGYGTGLEPPESGMGMTFTKGPQETRGESPRGQARARLSKASQTTRSKVSSSDPGNL